ncbi:MAG: hydroxymethylbilane synthase [Pseudoruegeria sp.]
MTLTMPSPDAPLNIGTRGSPLALAQAYETRERLMGAFDLPKAAFNIVVIKTTGDDRALIDADRPLKEIGNKGLFTKEIEEALLSGSIDIAVHSMKDMPTAQPDGLLLDTFLPREDVRDAFVSPHFDSIDALPAGTVVGTSSLRRKAQLLNKYPNLTVVEFRGNVQTRLQKLTDGVAACTFLAMAGLNRLGNSNVATAAIDPTAMLPAVAQGAIGIERRQDDTRAAHLLTALHDTETGHRLTAERAFLARLDGSCETPIAALATLKDDTLTLRGEILRPDGSESLYDTVSGPIAEAKSLGVTLADILRNRAPDGFFDW